MGSADDSQAQAGCAGQATRPTPKAPDLGRGTLDLQVIIDASHPFYFPSQFGRSGFLLSGLDHPAQMHDAAVGVHIHSGEVGDAIGGEFAFDLVGNAIIIVDSTVRLYG